MESKIKKKKKIFLALLMGDHLICYNCKLEQTRSICWNYTADN